MTSPHDRFFKALVSQPANAASLLADVLPAELADGLDLAQLRPAPTEYISEILARRDADLVFTVPQRGREMFVHFMWSTSLRTTR